MYDYYGYDLANNSFLSIFIDGFADSAATDPASLAVLAVSFITVIYLAAAYVAGAVIFMKAGEAPWKSLIPIYRI